MTGGQDRPWGLSPRVETSERSVLLKFVWPAKDGDARTEICARLGRLGYEYTVRGSWIVIMRGVVPEPVGPGTTVTVHRDGSMRFDFPDMADVVGDSRRGNWSADGNVIACETVGDLRRALDGIPGGYALDIDGSPGLRLLVDQVLREVRFC